MMEGILEGILFVVGIEGINKDKWGEILPLRILGKTGKKTTMLGLGGYHVGWTTEKDAQEVIETAMEGGVRFFDTAESYGNGLSEIRYGKYLVPKYRDEVFIMSKSTAEDGKTAKEHLEGTLKRLKCDYIDLWQVHSLLTPEDVDNRIDNKVLEIFEKAKAEGKVKHIGFTGHQNPFALKRMLDKTSDNDIFESVQMPINVIDSHFHSFIKNVLPVAVERNFGILAMKTLSDGRFFKEKKQLESIQWESDDPIVPNYISVREALYFVWSLPISVLITGAENKKLILEKIELARNFTTLSDNDRDELINRVFEKAGNNIEYYKNV
jgi:predicted aldo/keto reductase-like oxidoreductase